MGCDAGARRRGLPAGERVGAGGVGGRGRKPPVVGEVAGGPEATGGVRPPPAQRLPVLVYVHGGAFLIGSGRWGWYDGADLATALNCVVVSFNYRLGAFGFLDLSHLGPEFADSGNLGLLDQLAALQWVQQHIHRFGATRATSP